MSRFPFARPALLLTLLLAVPAYAQLPDRVGNTPVPSLAPLVEKSSPAVVNIRVSQTLRARSPFGDEAFRRFFGIPDTPGGSRQVASAGSGVIVNAAEGYILTNHHVVDGADEIVVGLHDGRELDAEVVGSDPDTDIAVIKVDAERLVEMPIGDSDSLRVGDFVIAIGNPFGLGHTVTSGIVSALGRSGIGGIDSLEDFIQTDASINPGNSGGALVSLDGELVGINSAIISRSGGNVGIGFAVPTHIARSVMNQILDYGEVRRGLLGVSIDTIDSRSAEALNADVNSGALITRVSSASAAEDAGLQVGDIIVAVNDKKIDNALDLRNAVGLMNPGQRVSIDYIRDGQRRSTRAELGERLAASGTGEDIHPGLAGAEFAAGDNGGVEVVEVADGSPAAQRGLRQGDIITAVNRRAVNSLADLTEVAGGNPVLYLLVRRGNRNLMLPVR